MDKMAVWKQMIDIIKTDVTPATGCTEPIALAYAAAVAARELGEPVRFIDGLVSANLMKNGMGVTVAGERGCPAFPLRLPSGLSAAMLMPDFRCCSI